jgi:hypothetical protein
VIFIPARIGTGSFFWTLKDRCPPFDFMDPPNPKSRWLIQIAKLVQVGALGGLLSVPIFEGIVPESAGDFVVYGLLCFVVPGLVASFVIRHAFPHRAFWGAVIIGVFVVALYVGSAFDWPPLRR